MIQKPQLPPVQGYVEVDVDGIRMYREISTGKLVGDTEPGMPASQEPTTEEILNTLLGVTE